MSLRPCISGRGRNAAGRGKEGGREGGGREEGEEDWPDVRVYSVVWYGFWLQATPSGTPKEKIVIADCGEIKTGA